MSRYECVPHRWEIETLRKSKKEQNIRILFLLLRVLEIVALLKYQTRTEVQETALLRLKKLQPSHGSCGRLETPYARPLTSKDPLNRPKTLISISKMENLNKNKDMTRKLSRRFFSFCKSRTTCWCCAYSSGIGAGSKTQRANKLVDQLIQTMTESNKGSSRAAASKKQLLQLFIKS